MEKKLNLKKLLATASAFAVISGASSSAMGAQWKTNGIGNVTLDNVVPVVNAIDALGAGGNLANGESFFWSLPAHNARILTVGANAATNLGTVDLNNVANDGAITTIGANAVTIGSIISSGGAQKTNVVVTSAGTLTLGNIAGLKADGTAQAAGDFSALGAVTLGTGGNAGTLVIDLDTKLTGTINSEAGNAAGVLTINAGKKVTLSGLIGAADKLATINFLNNSDTTFGEAVKATAFKFAGGKVTATGLITGGVEFAANGGTLNADAGIIGNVVLSNGGKVIVKGAALTGDVSSALPVGTSELIVESAAGIAGNVDLTNGGKVTTTKITGPANKLTLGNGATAFVGGDIEGLVDGAAVNTGVLTLTGPSTVTGKVGNTVKVNKIVVQADTKFESAVFKVTELAFVGDAVKNVTFTLADAANGLFAVGTKITTDGNKSHNIIVNAAQVIAGEVGTAEHPFGNVVINTAGVGQDITINTAKFFAAVTTNTNNKGKVDFNAPVLGLSARSIGTSGASVQLTKFTNSATVFNGLFSKAVDVVVGQTAKVGGTIRTDAANFGAGGSLNLRAGSTLQLLDEATLESFVQGNAANDGAVVFDGNATISKNIGETNAVNTVNFGNVAGKTVKLGANVTANGAVTLGSAAVKLLNDQTITTTAGAVSLTGNTLDLGAKKLTVAANAGLTFAGANNIVNVKAENAGGAVTGGNIEAGASVITFGDKLNVVIDDSAMLRSKLAATNSYTLLNSTGIAVNAKADKFNVSTVNADSFFKWEVESVTANGLTKLKVSDNSKVALNNRLANADATARENVGILSGQAIGSDGSKFIDSLQPLNAQQTEEAFNRLEVVKATDSIQSVSTATADGLATRTMSLAGDQTVAAPAAGDADAKFGAWFSPFFGQTTQKARKGNAGYKDDSFGASLGFDTKANDDLIIGAAFTSANSKLKHKNAKSGDKTTINSFLLSIYGMQQITDTWFAHGSATFGNSEVTNKEKRRNGSVFETATGKYSSMSFNADATVGYNVVTDAATFTPMAGLRYTRVNDGGYKETGTSFQNLDVSKKASNKFELVLGARVSAPTMDMEGFAVTPEAHAFVSHDFIGKNAKSDVKLGGAKLATKSTNNVARTRYNVGLGVNAEYGMMEYGAGYDFDFATKSTGHKGTLRLRVNF